MGFLQTCCQLKMFILTNTCVPKRIYTFILQARALTPQTGETDAIRFLVGTQSLKFDNQVWKKWTYREVYVVLRVFPSIDL